MESDEIYKGKKASVLMNVQFLHPSEDIINLHKLDINLYYEIEHLLSIDFWKTLKENDYVSLRETDELLSIFSKHVTKTKSLDATMDDLISDYDLLGTIVTLNPADDKKQQIKNLVLKIFEDNPHSDILMGLQNTINHLTSTFIH